MIENAPDGSDASVLAYYAINGLMHITNRILDMLPEDSVKRAGKSGTTLRCMPRTSEWGAQRVPASAPWAEGAS